jgi:GAF domain-containing protein
VEFAIPAKDFNNLSKTERYKYALQSIEGLCYGEIDMIAAMANSAAVLKEIFSWWWIGFYLVKGPELVLGPFQGPVACTRIAKGKGVCGAAWENNKTVIVENVDLFPGHIACSAVSKSEIVVPLIKNGKVTAVLDADSEMLSYFDEDDARGLEKICLLLSALT